LLSVTYGDGTVQPVPLGDRQFFVFKVPEQLVSPARTEMLLTAESNDGARVGHFNVTPILTEAAPTPPPLEVSTHTVNGDLTRISGFDGKVSVPGVTRLQLVYPDGGRVDVPFQHSGSLRGSFSFNFPMERFDDFTSPGRLIAIDRKGATVAGVWIAAPSFWTARNSSFPRG
jgi:hypothetical protein